MRVSVIAFLLTFAAQAGADEAPVDLYDDCLDKSGPINNSVVLGCSRQVE